MAVFRSTPQLGPSITEHDTAFWFLPPGTYDLDGSVPLDDDPAVSYKLGNIERGTDGHDYMMVKNNTGGTLAASARFNIADDGSFGLTTNVSGAWMVPADIASTVPNNAYFHARRYTL